MYFSLSNSSGSDVEELLFAAAEFVDSADEGICPYDVY